MVVLYVLFCFVWVVCVDDFSFFSLNGILSFLVVGDSGWLFLLFVCSVFVMADFDFESVQDEVLQKLPLLDIAQLEECCTELVIPVPTAKKGKRTAVRSLVLNHLTSDEFEKDDDVEEIITKLNDTLSTMVAGKMAAKETTTTAAEAVEEHETRVKEEAESDVAIPETGQLYVCLSWLVELEVPDPYSTAPTVQHPTAAASATPHLAQPRSQNHHPCWTEEWSNDQTKTRQNKTITRIAKKKRKASQQGEMKSSPKQAPKQPTPKDKVTTSNIMTMTKTNTKQRQIHIHSASHKYSYKYNH
jgi:hypothetical protein